MKRLFKKEEGKGPSQSPEPPSPTVSSILDTGYFDFLKKYSTNEKHTDKNRYQKIKTTSTDRFENCLLKLSETTAKNEADRTKHVFCGPVDGVDEVLSAYASLAQTCNNTYAIFLDINSYKVDYFTFRLMLTQISTTKEEYARHLFFYLKGDDRTDLRQILA
ncbi:hypothetical protein KY363_05705, partial [Candidatus Woesearchaeota archaeon]|nr:hypothetical protein [Candidatus Woesearchaeota archaeon]